ncbi:MAG: 50S ribosomal protein L1 [Nitrospirae bacterium]|nr:50S ribosomal protein L1 [Nitrospirota bacterium]
MGKKYLEAIKKVEPLKEYSIDDAIALLKEVSYVKFDQTVDLAVNLGVNPKKSDQMVRGFIILPNGIGRSVRVLVFAKGEKEMEATAAGADFVGGDDLVLKIQQGWLDFDKVVATPDVMSSVGKLGKILGPRGLMPNPKTGTVTFDIGKAVKEIKAGKVDFKVDKAGIVHMPVGKMSFDIQKLKENILSAVDSVIKAKPTTSKGKYLRTISMSGTMTPGLKIDISTLTSSKI